MERDDLSNSKPVEAELGLGLGHGLSRNLLKPRAKKMQGEGKKSRVKERPKPVEIVLDSDDEQPIGSLLKLKRPRNPKKVKVNSGKAEGKEGKLAAEDEDIGGMDDTLASFRKKLKAPKRDSGSVTARSLQGSTLKGCNQDMPDVANQKEKLKKTKISAKRVKIGADASNDVNGLDSHDFSSDDQNEELLLPAAEGLSHSPDEKFEEDSLSVFLRKAQSVLVKKSVVNPNTKQDGNSRTLEDEWNHNPEGLSEISGSVTLMRELGSPASNEGCKDLKCRDSSNVVTAGTMPDAVLQERKIVKNQFNNGFSEASSYTCENSKEVKDESMLENCISNLKRRSSEDPCSSHTVCDENCLALVQNESLEHQTMENRLKISSVGKAGSLVCDFVRIPNSKAESKYVKGINDGFDERKETPAPSFECMLKNKSRKDASNEIYKPEVDGSLKSLSSSKSSSQCIKIDETSKVEDEPDCNILNGREVKLENVTFSPVKENATSKSATSSDAHEQKLSSLMEHMEVDAIKGTSVPSHDYPSMNDEASGASPPYILPDENEMYSEDAVSLPDPEMRDANLSLVQRTIRKAKRRRHEDMAYEGDADWEILINEQSFLESDQAVDNERVMKVREKSDSSSVSAIEVENGGLAAVSAGLRARAVGPVEKIKFKEVLKRKGGLHEYLECRNKILGLWNKDVSRILPLSECGVTDTPSQDESARDSLIRNIYTFLDQSGYINVGVASEKEQGEPNSKHNLKLFNESNIEGNTGSSVTDLEDGVSFIVGQLRSNETPLRVKNEVAIDNDTTFDNRVNKSSDLAECEKCAADVIQQDGVTDAKLPNGFFSLDAYNSCEIQDGRKVSLMTPESNNEMQNVQSSANEDRVRSNDLLCDATDRKKILVIGAGPAGLTAARHLKRQGFAVTVLEARSRLGGRVYTDRASLSVPVDLGASIITGVEADVDTERRPDPSSLICAQLGLELTVLNSDCPLYDTVTGEKVPTDLDEALEAEYNSLLDDMVLVVAQKGERAMKMSLEDGLEYILKRRRVEQVETHIDEAELQDPADALHDSRAIDGRNPEKSKDDILSPLERRIMNWHFAHLEYGCAALLKDVSLPFWNQDDVYGGFGGAHCMIKGGYSNVVESLGDGLPIHLNHVVTAISYGTNDTGVGKSQCNRVKVSTSNGGEFSGDAVLITVPLGCLKAETIKFSPPLPEWKHASIQRLGFGVLNKVILEFQEVFWDDSVDYFGATAEETDERGHCFMFWNVKKTVGAPVLIALVVGRAAIDGQSMNASDHVNHAVKVLRKLFGEVSVPDPVASVVTDWGKDPFSYGAYSYVAVGSSGEDYDILGRPVDNCLFFGGEATCKEHPDTVGGAMMSGLREAVRIVDIFTTGNDYTAEVEAIEAAQRHSESENDEVSDITRRLEAVELSNALYRSSLDRARIFSREALLQDMFFSAKTIAGRLHLAKELLKIPSETLKSFAGTRKGLTTLNSWILDSMGKDGTQLLRHCVRLLVRVSTDLIAVRLSGIGKTVKEKVCVHTSRDIRAIASQLVNVWLEVFRKEKATNGGLKLLRQVSDSSKRKSLNNPASGKPPLRNHHARSVKMENVKDPKLESGSHTEEEASKKHAMSEEEQAALAAVEAARAAARAAAEAYASAQAKCNTLLQLPKIPSFHKFAKREQYGQTDEYDFKRRSSGGVLGRQDCISEIDSRNCRVRDWSLDFSAAYENHDSSRKSMDNLSQRSHSNEIACHMNFREQSGESAAVDSSLYTKAWVDTAGIKDYHAIERWQSQAAAADAHFFPASMHIRDEEDSNTSSKPPRRVNESSVSNVTVSKEPSRNHPRGTDRIKQAVVDFVSSLLMPVYKARKIDRDGYKSIMKKCATKVMEQATDAEKSMSISEFLDFKRKNKIRDFVDKLIERHMAMNPTAKP